MAAAFTVELSVNWVAVPAQAVVAIKSATGSLWITMGIVSEWLQPLALVTFRITL